MLICCRRKDLEGGNGHEPRQYLPTNRDFGIDTTSFIKYFQVAGADTRLAFLASFQAAMNVLLVFITKNHDSEIAHMGRTCKRTTSQMLPIGPSTEPRGINPTTTVRAVAPPRPCLQKGNSVFGQPRLEPASNRIQRNKADFGSQLWFHQVSRFLARSALSMPKKTMCSYYWQD